MEITGDGPDEINRLLARLTEFPAAEQRGGRARAVVLMVPALFVLIPGDFRCAASAEIAIGQLTPGVVRLAQAARGGRTSGGSSR